MKRYYLSCGAAAAAAAFLLSGCGGGTATPAASGGSASPHASASTSGRPGAKALATQVSKAMANATSVHMSATVSQNGDKAVIDADMTKAGGFNGTISYKGSPSVTLLSTQGKTYLKVTKKFLASQHAPAAACALMCGKWLKMSSKDAKGMLGDSGWNAFVGNMGSGSGTPSLTYLGTATVAGQPTWKLKVASGGTVYVAATGTPYLLRMEQGSNRIDFSNWGKVTIPPPPPASEVTDLSSLTG